MTDPTVADAPDLDPTEDYRDEDQPFVCPGCYAINDEPHAGWCPDDAIEREREEYSIDDEPWEDEEL